MNTALLLPAPANTLHIYSESPFRIPFFATRISAGFPSPAEDYKEDPIDLNSYLMGNPTATYLVRVVGDSMIDVGIFEDDMLVVDKSQKAKSNDIVVALLEGEFTTKRYVQEGNKYYLVAENKMYKPIELTEEMNFRVWGVVVGLARNKVI